MEKIDEEKYRQLLMRLIGDKMQGLAYVDGKNMRDFYNSVYETFSYGNNGYLGALESIRRHKKESGSNYPVYGYFDLDTLYAFHRFIDELIKDIANCYRRFNKVSQEDFNKLLKNNMLNFIDNGKSVKSAWFQPRLPITIAKNEKGYNPMKPISPSQYLKNYAIGQEDIYDVNMRLLRELDKILDKKHSRDGLPPKMAKEELEPKVETKEFLGVQFTLIENINAYTHEEPFTLVFLKRYVNNDYGVIDIFTGLGENDAFGVYKIKNDDDRYLKDVGNYLKIKVEQPIAYYPNKNGEENKYFMDKFKALFGSNSICPPTLYTTLGSMRIDKNSGANKSNDNDKFGEPTTGGEQIHFF